MTAEHPKVGMRLRPLTKFTLTQRLCWRVGNRVCETSRPKANLRPQRDGGFRAARKETEFSL